MSRRVFGSFAFRLGAAFAVVAIAGAAVTAMVVNAAFAARFDRFVHQQQATQLAQLSTGISRAYAGNGMWDPHALSSLIPSLGSGTLQILTSGGQSAWRWDGRSASWDSQWMQGPWNQGASGSNRGTWSGNDGGSGQNSGDSWTGGNRSGSGSGQNGGWSSGGQWGRGSGSGWGSSSGRDGFPLGSTSMVDESILVQAASAPTPAPVVTPSIQGSVQRIPIRVNGKVVGTAVVRLPQATALPDALAFREEVIRLVLLAGAVGAVLSLCLGVFFARRATKPVREVTGAARALAAGDRTARLDGERSDEFGEMGRAFNSMATAVEDEERLRQGFAAEVAHELRTPLTILRSQVEGLRVGVLQPTPESLDSLDEEVQRMTRLVADLQILGSADAAGFSLERSSIDLREIVEEAIRQFSGLFEGSEVGLETRVEPTQAWVDPIRVGQILANLLSNALKFTPPGGLVRVELASDQGWAIIRVSDSGPGIPADELPHVFDRFFRGRTARPSGSGIGLTVVRELVEAHGGTVEVASESGHGTTFSVSLPVQATRADNRFLTDPSRGLPSLRA